MRGVERVERTDTSDLDQFEQQDDPYANHGFRLRLDESIGIDGGVTPTPVTKGVGTWRFVRNSAKDLNRFWSRERRFNKSFQCKRAAVGWWVWAADC
jgi:hypothetical protein